MWFDSTSVTSLRRAAHLLPAACCLLSMPTAYCLLPTAYCLLPTAYCLLPTAYIDDPRQGISAVGPLKCPRLSRDVQQLRDAVGPGDFGAGGGVFLARAVDGRRRFDHGVLFRRASECSGQVLAQSPADGPPSYPVSDSPKSLATAFTTASVGNGMVPGSGSIPPSSSAALPTTSTPAGSAPG